MSGRAIDEGGPGSIRRAGPAADEVHVWWARPPHGPPLHRRPREVLAPDELERARRLIDAKLRRQWGFTRAWLRHVLAAYTGQLPEHVTLVEGPEGKPRLALPAGAPDLRFNLSHSGELAVVAVATAREVGVDVEVVAPRRSLDALVEEVCSPDERLRLRTLGADARLHAFLACWTRKEAWLKGVGTGLATDPAAVTVSLPGDGAPRLLRTPYGSCAPGAWSLAELDAPPGYLATLAVAGPPVRIRRLGPPPG